MASLFANPNSSLPAASSNFQGLYSGSNAHLMNNNASKPGQDWHRGLPPPSYSLPYNAPSPAFPGRPSMPPSHAALMQNALAYLELVQRTFAHQPDIYASFLSVMREHKEGRRDTPNLCVQVSRLFQGQDSLLRGFQDFLSGIHAVDPPLPSPAPSVPGPASFPHSMGHPSGYRGWNARPSAPPSHPPFLPGGNGTRPPLQTGVTEGGGEAKEDVSMEDAVLYMDRVKSAYADKPETYARFLEIIKSFQDELPDTARVLEAVTQIFQGRDDLIQGFNCFLPAAHRLPPPKGLPGARGGGEGGSLQGGEEGGGEGEGEAGQAQMQGAIEFTDQVRATFQNQPGVYLEFLRVMRAFQGGEMGIGEVMKRVGRMFQDHPSLLDGFNRFLPPQYRMPAPQGKAPAPAGGWEGGEEDVGEADALDFMDRVRSTFTARPEVYVAFLEVMRGFQAGALRTEGVMQEVGRLFAGEEALLRGFNAFLPHGYRMPSVPPSAPPFQRPSPPGVPGRAGSGGGEGSGGGGGEGGGGGDGGEGERDVEFAANFIENVRNRFAADPARYQTFLEVLQRHEEEGKEGGLAETEQLAKTVSELFRGHEDLLKDFAHFLPGPVRAALGLMGPEEDGKLPEGEGGGGEGEGKKPAEEKEEGGEEEMGMADAFKFLQRVREKIGAENEEKYNEFLDVLRGYEEKEIVPAEATRRVEALLGGDTELWEEFKGFLPDVGRREEEDEDEDEEDDEGQEEEEEEEGREEVESLLVKVRVFFAKRPTEGTRLVEALEGAMNVEGGQGGSGSDRKKKWEETKERVMQVAREVLKEEGEESGMRKELEEWMAGKEGEKTKEVGSGDQAGGVVEGAVRGGGGERAEARGKEGGMDVEKGGQAGGEGGRGTGGGRRDGKEEEEVGRGEGGAGKGTEKENSPRGKKRKAGEGDEGEEEVEEEEEGEEEELVIMDEDMTDDEEGKEEGGEKNAGKGAEKEEEGKEGELGGGKGAEEDGGEGDPGIGPKESRKKEASGGEASGDKVDPKGKGKREEEGGREGGRDGGREGGAEETGEEETSGAVGTGEVPALGKEGGREEGGEEGGGPGGGHEGNSPGAVKPSPPTSTPRSSPPSVSPSSGPRKRSLAEVMGKEGAVEVMGKEEAGPVDGEGRSSNHTGLGQDKASSPVQGNLLKGGGSDEGGKEGGQEGGQEGGKECLSRADASPSGL
ncbi:paired amphipathic helix protein sin3b [Nannochloropsis gaditana]|nr:paired amphipathic helix protein sin3b [Nannochloropsis gaditana]